MIIIINWKLILYVKSVFEFYFNNKFMVLEIILLSHRRISLSSLDPTPNFDETW